MNVEILHREQIGQNSYTKIRTYHINILGIHIVQRAYGKAGNGNETETGNGNWKRKPETENRNGNATSSLLL